MKKLKTAALLEISILRNIINDQFNVSLMITSITPE